jgi:hypothetical protein
MGKIQSQPYFEKPEEKGSAGSKRQGRPPLFPDETPEE